MSPRLTKWERILPHRPDRPEGVGSSHPMRAVVEQIAASPHGWTSDRSAKVRELFDSMAEDWAERNGPDRTEALAEALERLALPGRRCLEVGCGTGSVLGLLSRRFEAVVGVDLAMGMLRRADCEDASLIQGDAGRLPFADSSLDLIVAVNAFLFPAEYKRVLAQRGNLIFVSTNGDRTPIYLSPERVAEALGEEFAGVSAESGNGVWSCFSRHAFWEE